VVVSRSVGEHGTAAMLAREDFALRGENLSDCRSVDCVFWKNRKMTRCPAPAEATTCAGC